MTNHPKHGEAMWETLIDGHDVIVETAVTGTTVATNVRKRKDTSRTAKFDAKNPSKTHW